MSVRLVDRLFVRAPTLMNTDEPGSSPRNRKESTAMTPSRISLLYSCEGLAAFATDGVRKNTTRGGRVSESSAKANSSDPPRFRSDERWKHR